MLCKKNKIKASFWIVVGYTYNEVKNVRIEMSTKQGRNVDHGGHFKRGRPVYQTSDLIACFLTGEVGVLTAHRRHAYASFLAHVQLISMLFHGQMVSWNIPLNSIFLRKQGILKCWVRLFNRKFLFQGECFCGLPFLGNWFNDPIKYSRPKLV